MEGKVATSLTNLQGNNTRNFLHKITSHMDRDNLKNEYSDYPIHVEGAQQLCTTPINKRHGVQ